MRRYLMLFLVVAGASDAAEPKKVVSAREELARLEKELATQRALLVRMLELQNECTEQMINAAKGLDVVTPTIAEPPPPTPPVMLSAPPVERAGPAYVARAPKTASITGKVHVTTGGPAWVFVADVKGPAPSGAIEIKQEDKQFNPRVMAVPIGMRVTFPNLDVVYHNVFSLTPGQSFDLGMLRAGDPVKSRVMSKAGVVEIFCNLHSRMSASLLVTPGPLLTKVARDGTFTLGEVPLGSHQVSAWAGGQTIATQTVDLGAGGASVEFQLAPQPPGAHTNKTGQPYGSYDD
jgi:plastocyanin